MSTRGAVIKSSELGTRCWLNARIIEGVRCGGIMRCRYPEKKTCKAVDTEIAYQKERLRKIAEQVKAKVFQLERNKVGID